MDSVFEMAQARGWPDEALHREYFAVPEAPPRVDHAFTLGLARSGRVLQVPAERHATEVLAEAGIAVDTKCSDGLCGVCATRYLAGVVDHRDHVLGARERGERIVLCCSRARDAGGEITLDL